MLAGDYHFGGLKELCTSFWIYLLRSWHGRLTSWIFLQNWAFCSLSITRRNVELTHQLIFDEAGPHEKNSISWGMGQRARYDLRSRLKLDSNLQWILSRYRHYRKWMTLCSSEKQERQTTTNMLNKQASNCHSICAFNNVSINYSILSIFLSTTYSWECYDSIFDNHIKTLIS